MPGDVAQQADIPSAGRAPPTVRNCPACGAVDRTTLANYGYDEIWERYREAFGFSFSADVIASHTPARVTHLCECARCGLQYFAPSRPGGAQFYVELSHHLPYLAERWEFGVVARRVQDVGSLVDLGCGEGAFLMTLRAGSPGTRLVGIDHNVAGIQRLRGFGVEAYAMDVGDAAERNPGPFQVVCLFQTLEHVFDPLSLLGVAARLLLPGGRLFVSVPNRDRLINPPFDALDFPPHHVTRWTSGQLHYLARELDLQVMATMLEPPRRWDAGEPRRRRVRHSLERFHPAITSVTERVNNRLQAPRWWHQTQIRRGRYIRRGLYGHTILVELAKPV